MTILIKQALIANTSSPHNGSVKDILVENATITAIEDHIDTTTDKIVSAHGLTAMIGWVDTFAKFGEPGLEHTETLITGAAAAAAGGFTRLLLTPDVAPPVCTSAQVAHLIAKSKPLPVHVHPIGGASQGLKGKDLAEMYDMASAGAVAFGDGFSPIESPTLMLKALQYVMAIGVPIVQVPIEKTLSASGSVNEGIKSTQLGLLGIHSVAEEIMVQRDLSLLEHTNSKLHITGVSTQRGLKWIEEKKRTGLNATCSITPYHLLLTDDSLETYATSNKVNPPLRDCVNQSAFCKEVLEGAADCIATHHHPQHNDNKMCEFESADYGMIGLQTAFHVVYKALPTLSLQRLEALFSTNAREIFNLPKPTIKAGEVAELTLFTFDGTYTYTLENNKSLSSNTPFLSQTFPGSIIGTICKGQLTLNN